MIPLPPKPTKAERAQAAARVEAAQKARQDAKTVTEAARDALKAAEVAEYHATSEMFTARTAEDRVRLTAYLHTLPAELVEVLARAARREVLTLPDEEWLPFIRRRLAVHTRGFRSRTTWTSDGSTLITILRAHFEKETPCPTTP